MTTTTISSATREVHIGFDQPFVIIGERINPTGRKILAEEMKNGDYSRVEADALAQVEAGAHMLDVNAGIPLADEPRILAEAVRLGHRIAVLSRRPGQVREIAEIDTPLEDRRPDDPALVAVQADLWRLLREEAADADRELTGA